MKAKMVCVVLALAALVTSGCFVAVTPAGVAVGVEPTLAYIPGTPIQVVSNAADDVFFYGGYYWRVHNGIWYRSSFWDRGWVVWHDVPHVFLSIPPTHPKYHVVTHHPLYKPSSGPPVIKHTPAPAPAPVIKHGPAPAPGPVVKGAAGPPVRKKADDDESVKKDK